jgi:hypothetical protein
MASLGYSETREKLIHEKTRSHKSCAKLRLTTVMLSALLSTQLDLCDLCVMRKNCTI